MGIHQWGAKGGHLDFYLCEHGMILVYILKRWTKRVSIHFLWSKVVKAYNIKCVLILKVWWKYVSKIPWINFIKCLDELCMGMIMPIMNLANLLCPNLSFGHTNSYTFFQIQEPPGLVQNWVQFYVDITHSSMLNIV